MLHGIVGACDVARFMRRWRWGLRQWFTLLGDISCCVLPWAALGAGIVGHDGCVGDRRTLTDLMMSARPNIRVKG
jgi:hypothetical protein